MRLRTVRRLWARSRLGAGAGVSVAVLFGVGALLLLARPAPAPLLWSAHFPRVSPRRLAHALADFSSQPRLPGWQWAVDEESGNYSEWRYTVRYRCGPRCRGGATVRARDEHAAGRGAGPRHEEPSAHAVLVSHRACARVWLLPWLQLCDEWSTDTEVRADGAGGARLEERARASCGRGAGALAALQASLRGGGAGPASLTGAEPATCAARLAAHRELHLRRLRELLHEVS